MGCQIFRAPDIPFAQLQPRTRQRSRQRSALEDGACRGQQQTHRAPPQFFEGFYTFTRDFRVWLDLTKPFAWRLQRHRNVIDECLQIGEPSFGITNLVGDHDHQTLWQRASQGRDKDRIAAASQPAHAQ